MLCFSFLNYFMIWGAWLLYILIEKRKQNNQIDKEKMIKLVIIKWCWKILVKGGCVWISILFISIELHLLERVKKIGHVSQRNIIETWATQLLEGSKSKGWPLLQCYFLHSILWNDNLKFNFWCQMQCSLIFFVFLRDIVYIYR